MGTHSLSLTQTAPALTLTCTAHAHSHVQEDRFVHPPAWPLAASVPSGFSTSQEGAAARTKCSPSLKGLGRELLATLMGFGALGVP